MIDEFQFIDIETIIINVIIRYIKDNSLNQKSSNSSDSSRNSEIDVINENHENRFLNSDVGFFDLFYDDKFNNIEIKMKHIEKKTYFRNVLIFID